MSVQDELNTKHNESFFKPVSWLTKLELTAILMVAGAASSEDYAYNPHWIKTSLIPRAKDLLNQLDAERNTKTPNEQQPI